MTSMKASTEEFTQWLEAQAGSRFEFKEATTTTYAAFRSGSSSQVGSVFVAFSPLN